MQVSEVRLRPFTPADAPVVASWLDAPGVAAPSGSLANRWAALLAAGGKARGYVATSNGEPVGLVRLDIGPDRVAELTLAVARSCRRTGLGTRLLSLVLDEAKSLRIRRLQAIVDIANAPALAFFSNLAFEETRSLPGSITFVRWLHDAEALTLDMQAQA